MLLLFQLCSQGDKQYYFSFFYIIFAIKVIDLKLIKNPLISTEEWMDMKHERKDSTFLHVL